MSEYRDDPDLTFLSELKNGELKLIIDVLTKDKDGDTRLTEEMTSTWEYKNYYPEDCRMLWKLAATELQLYGGNTLANIFRGCGVSYKEILVDVANRMKVNFNEYSATERIEEFLLQKVMTEMVEEMSPEDKAKLAKAMDIPVDKIYAANNAVIISAATMMAYVKLGGFATYIALNSIIQAISMALLGHGVAWATVAPVIATMAGPLGWILLGIISTISVARPAYRVTVPATILIASLRATKKLNI